MKGPTLLVLAAGIGARFGGRKQFFGMGSHGETLADFALYDAWREGFGRALFIVRAEDESYCRDLYARRWAGKLAVETVVQRLSDLPGGRKPPQGRAKPWGTAHALWCARGRLEDPFAVINADDFYGRRAFAAMRAALAGPPDEGALVAYPIGETLSPSGSVARAICRVGPDGLLESILECRDVRRTERGIVAADAGGLLLAEDAPVSMNFWGLPPRVLDACGSVLDRLSGTRAADLNAELAISEMVAELLREGALRVRVLRDGKDWIGVTYREDAEGASRRLRALVDAGAYPL